MRMGLLGFIVLAIIGISQSAATKTPADFATTLLSVQTLFALIVMTISPVILCWRAMVVAPRFVDAYAQMMPENEEEIRIMFAERGVADVIAPWVMTKPGYFNGIFSRIGRRFIPPQ